MSKNMRSRIRVGLPLVGFCLLAVAAWTMLPQGAVAGPKGDTGILEKLVAVDGLVTIDLDVNRLTGKAPKSRKGTQNTLRFDVSPDAFFTSIAFNDEFRGNLPGTLKLVAKNSISLPARLSESHKNLVVETLPWGGQYEMVIRDGKSGFIFFNVVGQVYDYVASERKLSVRGGGLLLSDEFAAELGRAGDTKTIVGTIDIKTTQTPIEVTHIVEGETQSTSLPPTNDPQAGTVPGPDVVVGELSGLAQFGASSGTIVGLAVGTDSCNFGTVPLIWLANPDNNHPVIPQNLYRLSGGSDNTQRFEQVGQSQVKHAFTALQNNICNLGCNATASTTLGSGCSDPYGAGLNAGPSLGSKAWINPFTGFFPRNDSATPNNSHAGHGDSSALPGHRIRVEVADLNTTLNSGATYYTEAQYVTPHEYSHCQANPTQCNMYNNASYRQYSVTGTTCPSGTSNCYQFTPVSSTQRMKPAILAWTGATIVEVRPAPGVDGAAFVGYKVTNPSAGVWHYEYAVYNQNLDRAIQSFSIPVGNGVTLSNIGFRMPPQHPASSADGTFNNLGFSSTAWSQSQTATSMTWSSETLAQNQNANAIRWGTMYNFRFDSNRPPVNTDATVGFFKTGSPTTAAVQGPAAAAAPVRSRADFDGDGKTDLSVFRPSEGNWYLNRSTEGFTALNLGLGTDTLVPGDWDGDGKADTAVFRPDATPGNPDYWILQSSTSTVVNKEWGTTGDTPQIGDYDGDGKADAVIFRPSTNTWYVSNSGGGSAVVPFGAAGDIPAQADYNGDGKTDIAIFRPSTNQWWIANSGGSISVATFGAAGDKPVPADYDGDNKDDIAVFRPSTGQWWTLQSATGTVTVSSFGNSTDVAVPGDYDGDGKDDRAIYRNGQWWLDRSTAGIVVGNFGLSTDTPIPTRYIP